jgi:branched-chain amino acid transport system ATP-binding protein
VIAANKGMPMTEPLLKVRGVNVRFGGIVALEDVNVSISAGSVHGFIGPNGAGKTTLFDAIFGVNRPNSGSISYRGDNISHRSPTWRARQGMRRTFQRQQIVGSISVEDNVVAGMEWHGGGGGLGADLLDLPWRTRRESERRSLARLAMDWCGLSDLGPERASGLSIGHSRLLELARSVADEPVVLLLDEPTSGMSHAEVGLVQSVMARVRDEYGTTILIVEHDVPFIMSVCDRITALNLGKVIAEGTAAEVRQNGTVRESYFGADAPT